MVFKIDIDRWGRFFTVPCSIVDKHMRLADGNFIKVLLCVLASDSPEIDSSVLAEQSGVKESTVCDAMLFWSEAGVIKTDSARPVAKSQEAPAADGAAVPVAAPAPAEQKKSVRYSPKELASKVDENPDLKYLVMEYEKIKGTPVKDKEILGLLNLIEYYAFQPQSIVLLIEYCHKLGKDNIAYIVKVAEDWFAKDITDYPEIEAEIIKQTRMKSYEYKAARAFGLSGKLGKTQTEHFNKWQEMGFSIEMLEIAFNKCMEKKNELSFRYIDGILRDWAGKSIHTPEQVEQEDKAYAGRVGKKKYGDKETSYDLDEWDAFAENFRPKINRGENDD